MALHLLQTNLNHARRAQDLYVHSLAERGFGLGIAAEPYRVPVDHPHWAADGRGSVAITWCPAAGSPPMTLIESGGGFVAVAWGDVAVVGCYASPAMGLAEFEEYLDRVGECVSTRLLPRPVLIAGDFNAKSCVWGSPRSDARGEALVDWAATLGLCVLNTGSESTCVRWQGESIVDLTLANPAAARRVSGWRVESGLETLSDHVYISMALAPPPGTNPPPRRPVGGGRPRRWKIKEMCGDTLIASLLAATWPDRSPAEDVEEEASWLRGIVTDACDASMPRAGRPPGRRAAYWWSGEIAELRRSSVRARRRFLRARGQGLPRGSTMPMGSTVRRGAPLGKRSAGPRTGPGTISSGV
ncbi:uncharacterized protein LOC113561845 [Ooceraea biroi]|uniref:uncharacterized protein LOC113561845 n=1 Tax=Ooceraea biroi TaxID=2015173 RepID=UPI000F09A16A|nr:uncharacterized protein LOC113561845 [Ooceraea biroi]